MNLFDWIALALVALLAIAGYFRGLLTAALSLAGIVGGALLGARLAPYFLSGGSTSRYATLFALGGAIFCAVVLEAFGSYLGGRMRSSMRLKPLRAVDSAARPSHRRRHRSRGRLGARHGRAPHPRADEPAEERAALVSSSGS